MIKSMQFLIILSSQEQEKYRKGFLEVISKNPIKELKQSGKRIKIK